MRHFFRRLFNAWVAALPVGVMRGFLKVFVTRPDVAERAGFQVYPKVFYSPLPDPDEVDVAALREKRHLPGVPIDVPKALALAGELARFGAELNQFPRQPDGGIVWSHTYPSFDTATLYAMLRHLKPRRYIEVGCGYSSRASSAALLRNRDEGVPCEALYIEPFPSAQLRELKLPGEFLQKKVENVPLETFTRLGAGDVLFIDTSHVLKVQNDVEYEFIHVLPSLARGVFVHIHDIMTPYDYPEEWLVGFGPNRGGPNEQYALECLISGGTDWEVVLPVHLLWREHRAALEKLLPGAADRPAAFWIKKNECRP
jgi:hypothetical protein